MPGMGQLATTSPSASWGMFSKRVPGPGPTCMGTGTHTTVSRASGPLPAGLGHSAVPCSARLSTWWTSKGMCTPSCVMSPLLPAGLVGVTAAAATVTLVGWPSGGSSESEPEQELDELELPAPRPLSTVVTEERDGYNSGGSSWCLLKTHKGLGAATPHWHEQWSLLSPHPPQSPLLLKDALLPLPLARSSFLTPPWWLLHSLFCS